MEFYAPHPLQPFWNIAAAPIQTQALEQALVLGLFDRLRQPASADTVAADLQLDLAATTIWLELLWSLALLSRQLPTDSPDKPCYATSPLALRHFVEGADENCAQGWLYRTRFLARFAGQWETLLRDGFNPQGQAAPKGSWAQAAREQIGQEQRAMTVPAVLRLIDTLPPLPGTGRLLDLGGGPGHVGIALAQRLPGWQGVVCDQPETAEVAQENIQAAGLSDRLQALGCDLNTDSIGSGYDLIWCSAVLHFLQQPQEVVTEMVKALNPGGTLLLAHAEVSDEATLAARVLPFYCTIALRKNYLPQPGDMPRIMREAGLTEIYALGRVEFPMAPVWIYSGRRA